MPEAVKPFYEARRGFTNFRFNELERNRVAQRLAADGRLAAAAGTWVFAGTLKGGGFAMAGIVLGVVSLLLGCASIAYMVSVGGLSGSFSTSP